MIVSPFTRRDALRLFAANMALSLAACGKPAEEIVPYVRMPEGLVPGEPLRFATTLPLGGFGQGVIAISIDGRPIKIEGNPAHPASLGATNPFLEASVLSLYDPDRSRAITENGQIASRQAFQAALLRQVTRHSGDGGGGLRLLTSRVTSPTLQRQIADLLARFPNAAWHVHEPISDDTAREGARAAYGREFQILPLLDQARIVLTLDADPLGPGPDQIRNASKWSKARDIHVAAEFSRVYSAESVPTPTGMKADRRLVAHPDAISDLAIALANKLGAGFPAPNLSADAQKFLAAAGRDLTAHSGKSIVMVGRSQPAEIHALTHWINARLAAPQLAFEPVDAIRGHGAKTLDALVDDLNGGNVDTLLIVDTNPAYDALPELNVPSAVAKAALAIHLGQYQDETAALCRWHVPMSHPLESWSDLRASDGMASIVQPLVNPLYATMTPHELLAMVMQDSSNAYDIVRATWKSAAAGDFETWWRMALHDGVIADTAAKPVPLPAPRLPDIAPAQRATGMVLAVMPDAAVWDGRYANNPWLQECPKPMSKEVWGNALSMHPDDAARHKLTADSAVTVSAGGRAIDTPIRIDANIAPGVVAMSLGYGRTKAGAIGNSVGANVFELRTAQQPWLLRGIEIAPITTTHSFLTTQREVKLEGETRTLYPMRDIADVTTSSAAASGAPERASLYPDIRYDTYAWGMVIDTSVCIGCNACVVACQAENNIPVVGPEEIARGRDMHWLRVDVYDAPDTDARAGGFQPVPCMHCEHAPCEPVCPVAASVHDGEGLNVQVYNRCVGTRFCEANCPYKVRRFNFFGYADGQEYANLGAESIAAQRNPDVSVRQRGVMEKCTYCVQRISRARRNAEKEGRAIQDGEMKTACQSACPTRAISFGDIRNPSAEVSQHKAEPHHYALLGHLDTRPRTTYLADIRNTGAPNDGSGE